MKVLTSLTYYRPYTSGLTIYAERLACALSERGHQVSVLCMQHEKNLPREETMQNVRIVRAPILFRLSKGFISTSFIRLAFREVKACDIVHLHLPQFEGAIIALIAKLLKKPVVVTYHCDLIMPDGIFNQLAGTAVHLMNRITAGCAKKIITYTDDFAKHSPFLKRYVAKVDTTLPPVVLPDASATDEAAVQEKAEAADNSPRIGMAARLAAEKGVEVLVDAITILKDKYPKIKVLFAGPYLDVIGEHAYRERMLPRIKKLEESGNWTFLGNLSPAQMSAYYNLLDVLTVPSLNSTESFGLVQVEAMQRGVPSVTSDLPGVRQPVTITGMGKIFPIGDAKAMAEALNEVIINRKSYSEKAADAIQLFHPAKTAENYERIYRSVGY